MNVFGPHCDTGMFTSKFSFQDHLHEDATKFKSLHINDASHFEHFNVQIKQSYKGTSKLRAGVMAETETRMPTIIGASRNSTSRTISLSPRGYKRHLDMETGIHLVTEGLSVSLQELQQFL